MKYICNLCANVFQADDITIHHKKGDKGFEIVAICQSCLEKYLEKERGDAFRKADENKRIKGYRKW